MSIKDSSKAQRFSAVVPLASGDLSLQRLRDLVDCLFHFEPEIAELVIVDDQVPPRGFNDLAIPPSCRLGVLPNPRRGRGNGWLGGTAAASIAAFSWLQQNSQCDFAVKIDSDTLVIAPFASKIAAGFAAQPDAFLLGSSTKTPNRVYDRPEDFSVAPGLRKLQRSLTIWRRTAKGPWPRLQCGFFGADRKRKFLIDRAVANGYRLGAHCQGGAYAISRRGLNELAAIGALSDPLLWLWTPCACDTAVTLSVFACGGRAGDLNEDQQPFGVIARGLPDTPERLVERGFSLIHSVKDFQGVKEQDTREFFRQKRRLSAKIEAP